jgi:hypothetical protein
MPRDQSTQKRKTKKNTAKNKLARNGTHNSKYVRQKASKMSKIKSIEQEPDEHGKPGKK